MYNIHIYTYVCISIYLSISLSLKVHNHKSYTQRRAPPRTRLLTSKRSAPFPLALGFNPAIPAASRVAEYSALSRTL